MQGIGALTTPKISPADERLLRKISWRIVPFLFSAYVVSFLDRVNIGFAQLQMKHDLGFGDAIYGLGAGIFFIGYFLFEVPSNLLLVKIGARRTFSRIMFCWGIVSTAMMCVSAPWQFYALRFLLGAFEAGFFPGIVLYLTYWYPARWRATVVSWFFSGVAMSGVIGGLLSGWVMEHMGGIAGMYGWQWLFLIEGLPACVLGIMAYFMLFDGPNLVTWLSESEKSLLARLLALDVPHEQTHFAPGGSFGAVLKSGKVYLFSFIYFTLACGSFAISFWVPTMIKESGIHDLSAVGLYTAIPYGVAAFGIVYISRRSDAMLERRRYFSVCAVGGAIALSLLSLAGVGLPAMLVILSVAIVLIYAAISIFWTLPPAHLDKSAAAGGIALISSLGQIGGFASPYLIGVIKAHTGKLDNGLYVMSALLCLGAIVLYCMIRAPRESIGLTRPRQADSGTT